MKSVSVTNLFANHPIRPHPQTNPLTDYLPT